jgi:hypothetical protein
MWDFIIFIWSRDQQMKLSGFLTRKKRQYGYVARMDETRIAYTTYDIVWKTCLGRTRRAILK